MLVLFPIAPIHTSRLTSFKVISLSDIFISPLEDIYFVTELLGTDLHRLLTSRPLEKQFIQYFLYQILVSFLSHRDTSIGCDALSVQLKLIIFVARSKVCPLCWCCAQRLKALKHSCQ